MGSTESLPTPSTQPRGLGGWVTGMLRLYRASNRARARWAVSLLNPQAGEHVLDVGMGPGFSTRLIADAIGDGIVVGIEAVPRFVSIAEWRLSRHLRARRVTLLCADLMDLPRFDVAFDKVIAVNSVHNHPRSLELLKLLRARMAPGGVLVVTHQPAKADLTQANTQKLAGKLAESLEATGFHQVEPHFNSSVGAVPCICALGRAL